MQELELHSACSQRMLQGRTRGPWTETAAANTTTANNTQGGRMSMATLHSAAVEGQVRRGVREGGGGAGGGAEEECKGEEGEENEEREEDAGEEAG